MKNPYPAKIAPIKLNKLDAVIKVALPAIVRAREIGARSAYHFAVYLNAAQIDAPNDVFWNEQAILAALRRLKELGLDQGSLPKNEAAAVAGGGLGNAHLGRLLEEKLKTAGFAHRGAADSKSAEPTYDNDTDPDPLKLHKFIQKFKS